MALKETLQEIIIEHQNLPLMDIVPRDIAIERIPRKATTLIGIRRCGKTTVMLQREKEILSQGIENPVLVDKYMMGTELEVDCISDGEKVLIPGIMEHIEVERSQIYPFIASSLQDACVTGTFSSGKVCDTIEYR